MRIVETTNQENLEKRDGHDLEMFKKAMKNRKFRMLVYNNRFGKKLKMSV